MGTTTAPRWLRPYRRSNPFRRRTEVIEARMLLAVAALTVCAAPAAGFVAASAASADVQERRGVRSAPAVLVEDAPAAMGSRESGYVPDVHARVRWTGPDGTRHSGETEVPAGSTKGQRLSIRLGADGGLIADPVTAVEARSEYLLCALSAAAGTTLVLGAAGGTAHLLLNRRRRRGWEQEWARYDAYGVTGRP
ncbi:hypothetical protein [Streptomyces sp. SCSIO ZS0520]|uniref:Rv1733c family protein n=1 Tax=Streptomyces sp. SCSIO ZS0520 TaxID=2892996 RepID=UPI0021D83E08|nr:hypothetical protein [Streptomyces sp. SCSIO ZS0520]